MEEPKVNIEVKIGVAANDEVFILFPSKINWMTLSIENAKNFANGLKQAIEVLENKSKSTIN